MNVGEANAVNTVLRLVLDQALDLLAESQQASLAAEYLADQAYKRLSAGLKCSDVVTRVNQRRDELEDARRQEAEVPA